MGSITGAISRNRQQSRTKETYNPDLEYTQQQTADLIGGRRSPIGSYGMSGGQYVSDQPTQGFGTYRFGDSEGQRIYNPATGEGNVWGPGGGGGKSTYGQPGTAGGDGGGGYGYGGGGGGGGQGYGLYSSMGYGNPWGQGGAAGDINLAGGAAYGQYGQIARDYEQMGRRGVTGSERANLMSASNEPISANLAATRDVIANRAAQSGNTAGALGAQARAGAEAGRSLEAADRANQQWILAENQRRKEAALQGRGAAAGGQAGLYSTTAGYLGGLLAQRARLASLRQQGYTEGAGTGGQVSYSGSFGGAGG